MASIYKRGNKWAYKVYYTVDGKQKVISKSGFPTKRSATDSAILKENELLIGKQFEKENILLADYCNQWVKLFKWDTVTPKTRSRYETFMSYIEQEYNLPLKALTYSNYQEYLNKLATTRSKATVKKYHEFTKKAIKDAVKNKIILTDVTDGAILKGLDIKKQEENKFLSKDELNRLYQALLKGIKPQYTSRYLIILSMYTGMRFGECLGLQWSDIEGNTIHIKRGFDYMITNAPTAGKTSNAKRSIPVPQHVIDLLYTLPKHDEYVFRRITNNSVNGALMRFQENLNIKTPITFHGLRHTHASILLYEGVSPIAISKRLGHGSLSVTMDIYSHVIDEMHQRENEKILNILS